MEPRRLLSGTSALTGEYFNSTNTASLTNFVLERSDSPAGTFAFNWGNTAPATGVSANTFSVRWEGQFTAPYTGTYTFYVDVDNNGAGGASNGGTGGDQLWLNDNAVITGSAVTAPHSGEDSATTTLSLNANSVYNLKFEYYNFTGPAYVQLQWASGTNAKTPVPTSSLFDLTHTQTYTKPTLNTTAAKATTFTTPPAGWLGADVGGPTPTGSSSYSGGVYTVNGGGTLLGATNDQFQYAYQQVSGDFTFITRLASMTEPNNGSMAGIMVRSTLTAGALELFDGSQALDGSATMVATTGRPYDTQRYATGGSEITGNAGSGTTITFPLWLKIVRYGDKVTAYYAADNSGAPGEWIYRTAQSLNSLPNTVYLGMAVGSRASSVCTANFDNVNLSTLDLDHETSYLANSLGGGDDHVMNDAEAAYVDSDGTLYLNGIDEDQGMSIFNPDGSLLGNGNNSHYEGGTAITADANFIYMAQIGHYNYNSDGVQLYDHFGIAQDTAILGSDVITGLAANNGYLYVATDNLIYKFATSATATPSLSAIWEADNTANMAIDPSGNLWIIQNATSSSSAQVLHETPTGASAGTSITFPTATFAGQTVVPKGIAVDLRSGSTNGQVYVTDIGPLQQVHVFNSDGTYNHSLGVQFGAYASSNNGTVTANTLLFPIGVGIDSSGDVYVVGNPFGSKITSGQGEGTIIKKFNSYNTLLWERDGLSYVNVAAADPASQTDVYNSLYRFKMNYNATVPGTEATLTAVLYDPFLTTTVAGVTYQTGAADPRFTTTSVVTSPETGEGTESFRTGVVIREIGGQKYLIDFDQHVSAINIYRFLPNSNITVFCAELLRQTDRYNSKDDAFYIWTDANGDGVKQASEEQLAIGDFEGGGGYEAFSWQVDNNGNIWTADSTAGIREYIFQGTNSAGAPIYLDDANTAHVKRWVAPSLFTELVHVLYDPSTDSMYLSGYTTTYPRASTDKNYGQLGPELVKYANWTAGNNGASATPSWGAALPYTPGVTSDMVFPESMAALDYAGNYVFAAHITTSEGILVFQANSTNPSGTLVTTLAAGPEVAGTSALLDFRNGMSAIQLSNGQYEIFAEEDEEAKTLLYRWTPGVTLPAEGWSDADLGVPSTSPAGFGSFNDTTYGTLPTWTLTGSGSEATNATSDQLHFTSTSFTNDGSFIAKVATLTNTNAGARAGVMIRDSTSASSAFADVVVTPTAGIIFQWRTTAGAAISSVTVAGATPEWVKISRVSNVCTAYFSTNGTTWTQIGTPQTISFTAVAGMTTSLAGLMVSSQSASTLATATFTNVTINNPTVASGIFAAANPVPGTNIGLSVVGADPAGTAGLTYSWSTVGTPPAPVNFLPTGSNAAANTTASFTKAGTYTIAVAITDTAGFTTSSTLVLTVAQTPTTIKITPTGPTAVALNGTQQFTSSVYDQFSALLSPQPTITWSLGSTAYGTVSTTGLYTAPASITGNSESDIVTATADGLSVSSTVNLSAPAWLGPNALATWNATTHILSVTGATTIIADPKTDEPIITGSTSAAQVKIAPTVNDQDIHIGGVNLSGGAGIDVVSIGAARTHTDHNVLVVGTTSATTSPTFSIDSSSKLNLEDNDLIVHDGNLATMQSLAQEGRDAPDGPGNGSDGTWAGNGLMSSVAKSLDAAQNTEYIALAVVLNSDFTVTGESAFSSWTVGSASESLGLNDVIVKFTYYGDANLQGYVGTDAVKTVQGDYGGTATLVSQGYANDDWMFGDFDGSGEVNRGDVSDVQGFYGLGLPASGLAQL